MANHFLTAMEVQRELDETALWLESPYLTRAFLDETSERLGEAWHSAAPNVDVYHVKADCRAGRAIPNAKRRDGTGNKRCCTTCLLLCLRIVREP